MSKVKILRKLVDGMTDPIFELVPGCKRARRRQVDCIESKAIKPCVACKVVKLYADFREAIDAL